MFTFGLCSQNIFFLLPSVSLASHPFLIFFTANTIFSCLSTSLCCSTIAEGSQFPYSMSVVTAALKFNGQFSRAGFLGRLGSRNPCPALV